MANLTFKCFLNVINLSKVKNEIIFKTFSKHLPELGGKITINSDDFLKNQLWYENCLKYDKLGNVKTCSIDYFLFAFWCSSKISKHFIGIFNEIANINFFEKTLVNIISLIENFEWNRVKTVWLLSICCLEPNDHLRFCLFNSEYKSIVQFFLNQQKYQFYCQSCNKEVLAVQWIFY